VCSGKVALLGEMLTMGSVVVVAVHSTSSSTVVVIASERRVSASEAVAVASGIEDDVFALTSVADSSMVA
jgi:hypothetical protein